MPATLPPAPVAERRPHATIVHGVTLEDPYHWLRDPGYPLVEDPDDPRLSPCRERLFRGGDGAARPLVESSSQEMKGRIKDDDSSVPVKDGDWLGWWAFDAGAQYRKWYRRPVAGGPAELIFDEPAEAAGKDYFRGAIAASPDGRLPSPGSTTAAPSASAPGPRPRDDDRSRDGDDRRQRPRLGRRLLGLRLYRDERELAQLSRPLAPPRHDPADDVTLYEETEDTGFQVGVGMTPGPQPDRHRAPATTAPARSASSPPPTRPAPLTLSPRAAPASAIRSTPPTARSGSSRTTSM